jgi:protein-S-isoprenylcysteine O-methyltransferase
MGVFLALVFFNMALYWNHFRRHRRDRERPAYRLSWPTRVYRHVQVLLYAGVLTHLPLQAFWLHPEGPSRTRLLVGAALGAAGIALQGAALAALGAHFAACFDGLAPRERVRTGPYRWLRHPLYAANLLMMLGIVIATFNLLIAALAIVLVMFYAFAILDENRMLAERFPE